LVLASIDDNTGETEIIAMSWLDWNCHLFVTMTCGIGEGGKISYTHLRQLDKSSRAPPDKVIIKVAQTKVTAKY
jgi:hypothetical protein